MDTFEYEKYLRLIDKGIGTASRAERLYRNIDRDIYNLRLRADYKRPKRQLNPRQLRTNEGEMVIPYTYMGGYF